MIINKNNEKLKEIKNRGSILEGDYLKVAADIIDNIRKNGDKALFEYTLKFDKFNINKDNIKVSKDEIKRAYEDTPKELVEAIKKAHDNILSFHKLQMEKTWLIESEYGAMLGQKITPLDNAGIYVPGGKAAYFSSVLMNALPAKAAGVKNISMVSPATNGIINSAVLVSADICGIKNIYKIGGAQAIASLAYGTESVEKVDKITGPGNIYVAMAKKLVFGVCDIDMIAGPSEILIIADSKAEPKYIAADMLAQCEHDELASSITIVWDKKQAEAIEKEVLKQLEILPKKHIAEISLKKHSAIILVDSLEEACETANSIAPEHLELYIEDAFNHINKIRHAGAIFVGGNSPEAAGDYFAGPNHVLPTGGSAKFFSPLGTYDFFKRSSIIYYNKESLKQGSDYIITMAENENLQGHANSIIYRVKE